MQPVRPIPTEDRTEEYTKGVNCKRHWPDLIRHDRSQVLIGISLVGRNLIWVTYFKNQGESMGSWGNPLVIKVQICTRSNSLLENAFPQVFSSIIRPRLRIFPPIPLHDSLGFE